MFGFFSFLPLSTSDTVYHNGEIFGFVLHVKPEDLFNTNIQTEVSFILNLERDRAIVL